MCVCSVSIKSDQCWNCLSLLIVPPGAGYLIILLHKAKVFIFLKVYTFSIHSKRKDLNEAEERSDEEGEYFE